MLKSLLSSSCIALIILSLNFGGDDVTDSKRSMNKINSEAQKFISENGIELSLSVSNDSIDPLKSGDYSEFANKIHRAAQ